MKYIKILTKTQSFKIAIELILGKTSFISFTLENNTCNGGSYIEHLHLHTYNRKNMFV